MTIIVRSLDLHTSIDAIEREPRQHSGWESVRYKRKRFQLHEAIHGGPWSYNGVTANAFINADNPIKGRSK